MKIEKVKGKTFLIDTGMTYIPFYKVNDREVILLDSGWVSEGKGIVEALNEQQLTIVGIINSHAHQDHIGNNATFKEKYNCITAMAVDEAFLCSSVINLKIYFNTQTNTLTDVQKHYGYMICDTDILIHKDQNCVTICGETFEIVHTPGHSSSQICIITPDKVAYVGDGLITKEVMQSSKIPYSFILKEDLVSKYKLHELNCSNYVIAHKGVFTDIHALIDENIEFYKSIAENVYGLIDGYMTLEDIMKAAIKNFNIKVQSTYKYDMVFRILRCYAEYLNETGRINLTIEDGFLKYSKNETKLK